MKDIRTWVFRNIRYVDYHNFRDSYSYSYCQVTRVDKPLTRSCMPVKIGQRQVCTKY